MRKTARVGTGWASLRAERSEPARLVLARARVDRRANGVESTRSRRAICSRARLGVRSSRRLPFPSRGRMRCGAARVVSPRFARRDEGCALLLPAGEGHDQPATELPRGPFERDTRRRRGGRGGGRELDQHGRRCGETAPRGRGTRGHEHQRSALGAPADEGGPRGAARARDADAGRARMRADVARAPDPPRSGPRSRGTASDRGRASAGVAAATRFPHSWEEVKRPRIDDPHEMGNGSPPRARHHRVVRSECPIDERQE